MLRHPVATVAPALLLGALSESPYLLPEHRSVLEHAAAFLAESFAFYLYVAYAERLTSEARRSPESIPLTMVLRNLLLAAPVVPVIAVASLAAIALPTAAASLLVIPGLWLMTRWSLFAPVIVSERLGPPAALGRSNGLVRGNFELVFLTAALAVVLEEAVADAGTLGGWRSPARRPGENGWGGGRHRNDTAGGVLRDRARVRSAAALVGSGRRRLGGSRTAFSQLAKPYPENLGVLARSRLHSPLERFASSVPPTTPSVQTGPPGAPRIPGWYR